MDRYRTTYPKDDPPIVVGDNEFVGVDQYSARDNIAPGLVADAVNCDFTSRNMQTRGGFVCLPALGAAPFSSSAWVSRTSAADNDWQAIAYGNGIFVAVSNTGVGNRVMTSPTGVTWTIRTSAADNSWNGVAFGNGIFVAVASSGASRVMTSPDGITWTSRTAATANSWQSVAFGGGVFTAVSPDGASTRAMWSTDGITWTASLVVGPSSDSAWQSITYGGGYFVIVADSVVGAAVYSAYSSDGATWVASTAPARQWKAVTYGNGLYVAVASSGTGDRVMTTSGVPSTWTIGTSAADNNWKSVAYGSGQFIAVSTSGTGDRVMASGNGLSWQTRVSAADNTWNGVTYANGGFAAVSSTGTGNRVMTTNLNAVYASGIYSDPDDSGSQWIMLVGETQVGFYAFGKTPHIVPITTETVSEASTVVQCNNLVYIFRGPDDTPLYWTGVWGDNFTVAPTPTPGVGFSIIPNSNQATYYQNRLWVTVYKDRVAASDVLDFEAFDDLANDFNLNTGDSDYVVTSYPFGDTTLVVFKNRSIIALTAVDGALSDVVATEITRQQGAIGINAVVSVGTDMVYMSDRNINLVSLTQTNNALQHKTLPLSTPIQAIMKRVNWNAANKVSMAYWDNKLFVALPIDNATSCNSVVVYNFITESWFGEWNFAAAMGISIQGWVTATFNGSQRLHCVTEDGRILVVGEGQNDISGTIVSEISTSMTTRAYVATNANRQNSRMWMDLETNRPNFSITGYVDGASESSALLSSQTYSRAVSWIFNDSTYTATNANDDYNRAGRQDYSTGPDSIQSGTGFQPEMTQAYRFPLLFRSKGRLVWYKVTNTTGFIAVDGVGGESRTGDRSNYVQVI
jgi:hypothetical protein